MRYVAYCMLIADQYWKMLRGREAVQVCIKALHALVYRQRGYILEPLQLPQSEQMGVMIHSSFYLIHPAISLPLLASLCMRTGCVA